MDKKEKFNYEKARQELADAVAKLESGGLDLDTSLKLWERADKLAKECKKFLEDTKIKLQK
ncbi:exodeoxyribonuclease 7 small subunit [Actinomycetota bacterium]|nr:exodeoxyribonuclease 7 small subunit [Actinomycetota bacterium]